MGSQLVLALIRIRCEVCVLAIMILSPAEMNWSHKQTWREEKRSMCGGGEASARPAAIGTM